MAPDLDLGLNPDGPPSDTRGEDTFSSEEEVTRRMLKTLRTKMQDDKGFTLIELMVVVLIIAILIAIAIPTFLGLRRRAQDRAAQSDLRNAMTAAKAFYTDDEAYTGFNVAQGELIEPSLNWDTPADPDLVTIAAVNAQDITFSRASASGTNFCIADSTVAVGAVQAGTYGGTGAAATFAACAALPQWLG
jgi:type IV pilus assembly protein PilA